MKRDRRRRDGRTLLRPSYTLSGGWPSKPKEPAPLNLSDMGFRDMYIGRADDPDFAWDDPDPARMIPKRVGPAPWETGAAATGESEHAAPAACPRVTDSGSSFARKHTRGIAVPWCRHLPDRPALRCTGHGLLPVCGDRRGQIERRVKLATAAATGRATRRVRPRGAAFFCLFRVPSNRIERTCKGHEQPT